VSYMGIIKKLAVFLLCAVESSAVSRSRCRP
jgi:hypothetical protein